MAALFHHTTSTSGATFQPRAAMGSVVDRQESVGRRDGCAVARVAAGSSHHQPAPVPAPAPVPDVVVVEFERPAPLPSSVYLRRRLGVLIVAVLALSSVVAGLAVLIEGSSPGSAPLSASGTSTVSPGSSGQDAVAAVHLVQPGDTLWSIAADIDIDRHHRVLVEELIALNGGAAISVGQQIMLPVGAELASDRP